jgi:hypothetical protein
VHSQTTSRCYAATKTVRTADTLWRGSTLTELVLRACRMGPAAGIMEAHAAPQQVRQQRCTMSSHGVWTVFVFALCSRRACTQSLSDFTLRDAERNICVAGSGFWWTHPPR